MAKQTNMVDLDDTPIAPLNAAATEYHEVMMERIELNKVEKARKDRVIALMNEHGRRNYRNGTIHVELDTTESTTLKVTVEGGGE